MDYSKGGWYALSSFLLFMLLAYYIDIQPHLQLWNDLRQDEERLRQEVALLKQQVRHRSKSPVFLPRLSASGVIDQFYVLARTEGLTIQSLKMAADTHFSMAIQAGFNSLLRFIEKIDKQFPFLLLGDFSCEPSQGEEIRCAIIWIVCQQAVLKKNKSLNAHLFHYPFCSNTMMPSQKQEDADWLSTLTLDQLKRVGYMQQQERRQTLLSLPNHRLIAVQVGTVVGKEQGLIVSMNKENMQIKFKNNHTFILK